MNAAIGPNAITRVAEAVTARHGYLAAWAVFVRAGLAERLAHPPTAMVPEAEAGRLHLALVETLGAEEAAASGREAGRLTASYLLEHRIPRPLQAVLRVLPRRIALWLLCAAMAKHAWTFAGSGRFSYRLGRVVTLRLAGAPIAAALVSATPCCDFYAAVFEQLFDALVAKGTRVVEVECSAAGAEACLFRVDLPGG